MVLKPCADLSSGAAILATTAINRPTAAVVMPARMRLSASRSPKRAYKIASTDTMTSGGPTNTIEAVIERDAKRELVPMRWGWCRPGGKKRPRKLRPPSMRGPKRWQRSQCSAEIHSIVNAEEALQAVNVVWRRVEPAVITARLEDAAKKIKYPVEQWNMAKAGAADF
jgi:putative SOS response-associated peptidase YedK